MKDSSHDREIGLKMRSNGLSNIAKGFKDRGFQLVAEGILHRDGLAKQGHRYKIVDLDRLTLR